MERRRTDYVILGMLSIESKKSGYDIRKGIEGSVGYFWGESYGQIYPALKRLAAEGLIVPSSSSRGSKKKRQEYSLTAGGHACLREWLAVPFQNDPPRNEFLLKLFFGGETAPSVAIKHVRDCEEKNRRMLATLEEIEGLARKQGSKNPHQPYWNLTLDLGIALTRAGLEWCETTLATLSSMKEEDASSEQPGENIPHKKQKPKLDEELTAGKA